MLYVRALTVPKSADPAASVGTFRPSTSTVAPGIADPVGVRRRTTRWPVVGPAAGPAAGGWAAAAPPPDARACRRRGLTYASNVPRRNASVRVGNTVR